MKLKSVIFAILLAIIFPFSVSGEENNVLKINGIVETPLELTLSDMAQFRQSEIQLNDINKNGEFKGIYECRGVSLKTLLGFAGIKKTGTDFKKPVDVAVVLKNKRGDQVVLSWGEIFYKDPDHIIVATSADPVFPHKGEDHFKDKAAYEEMIKILKREVDYPRLVVSGDLYTDRCLESLSEISVLDLKPEVEGKKSPTVFSESFKIVGPGISHALITQLPDKDKLSIRAHVVGEGRGYHGTHDFTGIPLSSLMEKFKPGFDLNTVFMVSAPDAYRSLVSYGELFLNTLGSRILVTKLVDGKSWGKNGGNFILVFPDDLMADREVKAVSKIEMLKVQP